MTPDELINACIAVQQSFNPAKDNPDTHADVELPKLKGATDQEKQFIRTVFNTCLQYKKLLKALLTAFYKRHSGDAVRSDLNMYQVFACLVLFRIEEMKTEGLKPFIDSQEPLKMFVFLSYLLDDTTLKRDVWNEWKTLYDETYLQNNILQPLRSEDAAMRALVTQLQDRVTASKDISANTPKKTVKPPTKSEPFALTQTKVKQLPVPTVAEQQQIKAKPVPHSTYNTDNTIQTALENSRTEHQQTMQRNYSASAVPAVYNKGKAKANNNNNTTSSDEAGNSTNAQRRTASVSKINPTTTYVRPSTTTEPVKLNAAAILREEALFRKKQEEEAKLFQAYESGQRDAYQYNQWRVEMKKRDEEQKVMDLERRRIEAQLSHEEAIEKKAVVAKENRVIAEQLAEESEVLRQRREEEQRRIEEDNRRLAEQIQATRDNAKKEQEKIVERKRKEAEQVALDTAERRRLKELEESDERKRKEELIRHIRALENTPKTVVKMFDPTETPQTGLFSEMSMAEMQQRLIVLKQRQEAEREEKRLEIIKEKQLKADEMTQKMESMAKIRELTQVQAEQQREWKKRQEESDAQRRQQLSDDKLIAMQEKLQAKRAARKDEQSRLDNERRKAKAQSHVMQSQHSEIEEKRNIVLEETAELAAKNRLSQQQQQVQKSETLKSRIGTQRTINTNDKEKQKQQTNDKYSAQLENGKATARAEHANEQQRKANLVATVKGRA